jgi:hypothetical protein
MTDKSIIIEPTIIESKIRVWLTDINQPDRYEYFIEEIVYIANGIWTIRSINLRHRHPIEYIQIQDPPRELPIYKFFLIYILINLDLSVMHTMLLEECIFKSAICLKFYDKNLRTISF